MKKGKCINKVKDKDLAIVKKIKNDNCSDSFKELSSGYDNFYFSIAKKYVYTLMKMGMSREDIKLEKDFILYKAVSSFDSNRDTKFSTWFCNCARYHFLNYINSNKKYIRADEKTIDFLNIKDTASSLDKDNDLIDYLKSLLLLFKDDRVCEVYKLRYFSDNEKLTTWGVIAKKLNMSTQTAINLHEKARVFLKTKMQSKNSFDLV